MKQPEVTDRNGRSGEARPPARKPYHKPAVRHEQVFETRALTCGKQYGTQGTCKYNRKHS
jgi:hypothetical protein